MATKQAWILKVQTGKLAGQFRFKLKAVNGKTIAQSYPETYTQKHNCKKVLQQNFSAFEIVDKTQKK